MKQNYILFRMPSRKAEQLYRPNGMLIAVRGGNMVQFGEHPLRQRLFFNDESASKWLVYFAALDEYIRREGCGPIHEAIESGHWDAKLDKIEIEVREGEPMIDLAQTIPAGIGKQ